jgi:hypothetical protein
MIWPSNRIQNRHDLLKGQHIAVLICKGGLATLIVRLSCFFLSYFQESVCVLLCLIEQILWNVLCFDTAIVGNR